MFYKFLKLQYTTIIIIIEITHIATRIKILKFTERHKLSINYFFFRSLNINQDIHANEKFCQLYNFESISLFIFLNTVSTYPPFDYIVNKLR